MNQYDNFDFCKANACIDIRTQHTKKNSCTQKHLTYQHVHEHICLFIYTHCRCW